VWRLQVAERFLEGSTLYVDAIDPNGPMITLLYSIPVLLNKALHIPQLFILEIYLSILTFAVALIICLQAPNTKKLSPLLPLMITCIVVLLTGLNSGQKEHLFFLFAAPFIYQIINPFNVVFSKRTQFLFGVLAGIGVSIKPFFILLPITFCLILLATREFKKNSITLYSIFTFNFIFYLTLLLTFPEYIDVLQIAKTAYPFYFRGPVLWGAFSSIPTILLIVYLFTSSTNKHKAFKIAATLVSLLAIGMVQQKWFLYHYYPSAILSALAIIYITYRSLIKYKQISLPLIFVLVCNLGFIGYFWIYGRVLFHQQYFSNMTTRSLTSAIEEIPIGEESIILSTNMEHSNYPYFYLGKQNRLSFSNLWTLPAIFKQQDHKNQAVGSDALLEYTYNILSKDLSEDNLTHVFIQTDWPSTSQVDEHAILHFLQEDTRLNRILESFEIVDSPLQDYIFLKRKI